MVVIVPQLSWVKWRQNSNKRNTLLHSGKHKTKYVQPIKKDDVETQPKERRLYSVENTSQNMCNPSKG